MATLADVRCKPEFIASLRSVGMDSVRINSAHVDPPTIAWMVRTIRDVDPGIRILMDTKGPELRTTANAGDAVFVYSPGDRMLLRGSVHDVSTRECLFVNYTDIAAALPVGTHVLFDDGAVEAEVLSLTTDGCVLLDVVAGGEIGSRKTVNVPGVSIPGLPPLNERDIINLHAAVEAGIDYIAHSFVRDVADIEAVRAITDGSGIKVFAKIECREGVENMEAILDVSDGLLVARGDLGVEIPVERVPIVQRKAVKLCRRAGKPVIVATQFLQSMMHNPRPTRAEVGDISCSAYEGVNILLLCGETAQGDYPVECVDVMRRVINETCIYRALCPTN